MVPTRQELQIMRIIWERGELSVRGVYEEMRKHRRIAYTTVMTHMNLLVRKRRLTKRQSGRTFIYAAVDSREQVLQEMLQEFVDRVFQRSVRKLVRTARAISRPSSGRPALPVAVAPGKL